MFKNHSIKIKFVKDSEEASTIEETKNPIVNDETIVIAKDLIKHTGVAVVIVSGAIIGFKTLGEIAVVTTQAAVNKK